MWGQTPPGCQTAHLAVQKCLSELMECTYTVGRATPLQTNQPAAVWLLMAGAPATQGCATTTLSWESGIYPAILVPLAIRLTTAAVPFWWKMGQEYRKFQAARAASNPLDMTAVQLDPSTHVRVDINTVRTTAVSPAIQAAQISATRTTVTVPLF